MPILTEQFHFPSEYDAACDRLTTLVRKHARRLLETEYWSDRHLSRLTDHSGRPSTYIREDDSDCFADSTEYLYSRFKRCVYQRVTQILTAHTDEYHAFQFIIDTVDERKIRRIGWRQLRARLFDESTSPYIPWNTLETAVEKLNRYYDCHGCFPDRYTELVSCPRPNGTLPYAPDGRGDIHELTVEDSHVIVTVKTPDSLSPDSYHDWTEHQIRLPAHARFQAMLDSGILRAPTLHASEHGYTLDVPIHIPENKLDTVPDRVLAVDLGVKKQATAVPVELTDDPTTQQLAPPTFLDHPRKAKLFRLNADAEGINNRLAELRRNGMAHTEQFDHLLAEFRQTRTKERRLRHQIQHDLANQLVWIAAKYGCETIVFESLGQLDTGKTSGVTAWSISSWARGDLLTQVKYKADLLGIGVETVNPWGTSQYCPRCGDRGHTVKAPDDHTETRAGGHFHCPGCGYECDRDVVGALNVGRKYLSACRMERANPVAYMDAGNYASFPSHDWCVRSAGVQSTTEQQDSASGRQTQLSQFRPPSLTTIRGGAGTGGLPRNHGSDMGVRTPSGSVTQYILADKTDCD
jgi:putative transposase